MLQAKDLSTLSIQGIKRLPHYLKYLKELDESGTQYASSTGIADSLGIYEVQVRKDLACISSHPGKPRVGFSVRQLIADIEHYLGYDNANLAVLVGAGHLGQALLSYGEFAHYGLDIVAAFDVEEGLIGATVHDKPVFHIDEIEDICRRLHIHIGIITTPSWCAQAICDRLIRGGVMVIWNFAHAHLRVPPGILVQNEDMAASFAVLSNHLAQSLQGAPVSEDEL